MLDVRAATQDTFAATDSPASTWPAGLVAGDVVHACFVTSTLANASGAAPSGWTKLLEVDVGSAITIAVYWYRAAGGETGALNWPTLFDAAESGSAIMVAYQDALASGDPHAGFATETTTSGTAKDTASSTPTNADCLAIGYLGHNQARTFVWDAGITERLDSNTAPSGGDNPGWWLGTKLLSGTPATSLGGDASGSCATGEVILFLRPAAGGTPVNLAATIASKATVAAALRVEKPLAATIASRAQLAATLRVEKPLAATIASVARMTANLSTGSIVRRLRTLLGVGR